MKKLSLAIICSLLFFVGCNKEELIPSGQEPANKTGEVNRFFGVATPENKVETKGVAQSSKLWNTPITIKFLDGTTELQDEVKTYASEWLQYANVKFEYVADNEDADVRISLFEENLKYVTWSYTGTDCKEVTDQNEPTALIYCYIDLKPAERKGDVLRLFGQILGLELEHRHLNFDAQWKKDVKNYWTDYIEDIPWETLAKYVFNPLLANEVEQTTEFDENSIMIWAFPGKYLSGFRRENTKLSDQDKEFIAKLYP